jgi:Uma2 family endonuclease
MSCREEYLLFGLLEYWIVDLLKRQVMVLTRHGDVWSEAIFRDNEPIISLVLPGLDTTVAELWIDVDQDDEHILSANGA